MYFVCGCSPVSLFSEQNKGKEGKRGGQMCGFVVINVIHFEERVKLEKGIVNPLPRSPRLTRAPPPRSSLAKLWLSSLGLLESSLGGETRGESTQCFQTSFVMQLLALELLLLPLEFTLLARPLMINSPPLHLPLLTTEINHQVMQFGSD
ncbi:hypothetical protein V2J09_000207 [Rumex salicifolius]